MLCIITYARLNTEQGNACHTFKIVSCKNVKLPLCLLSSFHIESMYNIFILKCLILYMLGVMVIMHLSLGKVTTWMMKTMNNSVNQALAAQIVCPQPCGFLIGMRMAFTVLVFIYGCNLHFYNGCAESLIRFMKQTH